MSDDRAERLARQIRSACGQYNNDDQPVVLCVAQMRHIAEMYIATLEAKLAATQQRLAEAEELIDNTYAMGFYTIGAGSGLTHKDLCRKFAAMGMTNE